VANVRGAPLVLEIQLTNHLSAAALQTALDPLSQRLRIDAQPFRLVVDCLAMTGYDGDARSLFVEWNEAHRRRIERVAVVTGNKLWQMVVSAMALASRQEMKAFDSVTAARTWAGSMGPPSVR
jgi:hypothetical protein